MAQKINPYEVQTTGVARQNRPLPKMATNQPASGYGGMNVGGGDQNKDFDFNFKPPQINTAAFENVNVPMGDPTVPYGDFDPASPQGGLFQTRGGFQNRNPLIPGGGFNMPGYGNESQVPQVPLSTPPMPEEVRSFTRAPMEDMATLQADQQARITSSSR